MKAVYRQPWMRVVSSVKFFLLIVICISACRHPNVMISTVRLDMPQVVVEAVKQDECTTMPADSFDLAYVGVRSDSLFDFYAAHNFKPLWFDDKGLTGKADSMVAIIKSARFYGLLPQDYHLQEVDVVRKSDACTARFRLDVLLTDAFLTMAFHLQNGRLGKFSSDSVSFKLLMDTRTASEVRLQLESKEPGYAGYRNLKAALKNILDTARSPHRDLLLNGITSDSIPLHRQIQTIEVNLERWRWEKNLSADHVWVNIPAYRALVFEDDSLVLESKVIVGAQDTPTPVLSSRIECFVVYPYWHVPRKIAVEEYLPVIKKDLSFITANNFEVLDLKGNVLGYDTLEWSSFNSNYFPVMLRQREGSDNALGVVKFYFDNRYAVYLHDTNAKKLFQRTKRALSHGCIRMEKAVEFAHYLAKNYTKRYSDEDIDRYIRLKQKHTVDLVSPLPIYLRYFTCESNGVTLQMHEDIYFIDRSLISSFYKSLLSF